MRGQQVCREIVSRKLVNLLVLSDREMGFSTFVSEFARFLGLLKGLNIGRICLFIVIRRNLVFVMIRGLVLRRCNPLCFGFHRHDGKFILLSITIQILWYLDMNIFRLLGSQ